MYDLKKGTTMNSICSCERVTFKESKWGIKSCWLQSTKKKLCCEQKRRHSSFRERKARGFSSRTLLWMAKWN